MDAFAASVCQGLSMRRLNPGRALTIALFFGGFQALMPALGYLLGNTLYDSIQAIDHWVAFALLLFIGCNMVRESRKRECEAAPFTLGGILVLSLATSVNALAVGVTFAFLSTPMLMASSIIGGVTFALSFLGVYLGSLFGTRFKSLAELLGGLILIGMAIKALVEGLI